MVKLQNTAFDGCKIVLGRGGGGLAHRAAAWVRIGVHLPEDAKHADLEDLTKFKVKYLRERKC